MDLGLHRAGFRHAFFAESDTYRRRVLARHWPDVPVYDDVKRVALNLHTRRGPVSGDIGLLCGGFPCQDLSVAGRRRGLAGDRSGLFFEFARVADALLKPGGWVLIENVPGLLSSNGGRDFAVLRATLAELGFLDGCWRVLDSRFFGVPQRRRRVFIVARRARGGLASEVLLEPEGGDGDPSARGEAGAGPADALGVGFVGALQSETGRRLGADEAAAGQFVARAVLSHGRRLNAGDENFVAAPLTSGSHPGSNAPGRRKEDDVNLVRCGVLQSGGAEDGRDGAIDPEVAEGDATGLGGPSVDADGMRAASGVPGRVDVGAVNPFDPRPDGARYAACGDAVTVPVAEWIGRRLLSVMARS